MYPQMIHLYKQNKTLSLEFKKEIELVEKTKHLISYNLYVH